MIIVIKKNNNTKIYPDKAKTKSETNNHNSPGSLLCPGQLLLGRGPARVWLRS